MTRHLLRTVAILLTSVCATTTITSAAPMITNIGSIPGGIETGPTRVSADGTIVVGDATSSTGVLRAFRWTASTGAQDFGPSDPTVNSVSQGVNSNGSVVVGFSYGSSGQSSAFRWTSATGMQDLGLLSGGSSALANGVSADGSVVVGGASSSSNVSLSFRWTAATGMQALPVQGGFALGSATGVSSDGSVTVGYSTPSGSDGDRAYRYTTAGGYQNLGVLPGFDRSYANGVSGDGNTVIGSSQLLPVFFEPRPQNRFVPIEIDDSGTVLGWTGHDLALWGSTGALLSVLPAPAAGLLEFGYGGEPSVQRDSAGNIVAITRSKDGICSTIPIWAAWTDITASINGLPAGSTFDSIQGFNDHGEFVGLVAPPGLGRTYGFVASPVPEPATFMLSVIGLAAVGGCRRGQRNR